MKKLITILALAIVFMASTVWADVQFTVNWNQSPDAVVTLTGQELIYDGVTKDSPALTTPGAPHSFVWVESGVDVADVIGKVITVRTYNLQALYADFSAVIGSPPNPATGVTIFLLQQ